MNLTREQAIAEHRKMWNWIADVIENAKEIFDIHDLKIEYLKRNGRNEIRGGCFLCEYAKNLRRCFSCPLTPKGSESCLGGLFWDCVYTKNYQEQARLARQIANLPERTDV